MTDELTGLEGDFDTISLLGMLWWLFHTRQTVAMGIETAGKPAWLFFRRGILYRCQWGTLRGRRALFALTTMRTGAFWLSKRLARKRPANIETPTLDLLRQCERVKRAYATPNLTGATAA